MKGAGKGQKGKGKQGKGPYVGYGAWGANYFGEQEAYDEIPLMAMTVPSEQKPLETTNRFDVLEEENPDDEVPMAWTEVVRPKPRTKSKKPGGDVQKEKCAAYVGLLEKTSVGLGNLASGEWQELPKHS